MTAQFEDLTNYFDHDFENFIGKNDTLTMNNSRNAATLNGLKITVTLNDVKNTMTLIIQNNRDIE